MKRGFKTRCENLSLQLRKQMGLLPSAPLSPHSLAEHIHVWLAEPEDIVGLSSKSLEMLLHTRSGDWSAVTLTYGDVNLIIYNRSHSIARQSSDLMHELAHILLGHAPGPQFVHPQSGIILRDYNQEQEDEATWFAGCLLLPRMALLHARSAGTSNEEICQLYGVSLALLEFRLRLTGVDAQFRHRTHSPARRQRCVSE